MIAAAVHVILLLQVASASSPPIPRIVQSSWWNITSPVVHSIVFHTFPVLIARSLDPFRTPDLGAYNSPHQQPVDFAVWQASDGSYQLESCIRNTLVGGHSRLFYRWESNGSKGFFENDWRGVGISMIGNASYGEDPGGLQAPHVTQWNGVYHKFYGTWRYLAQATSTDGKHFDRVLDSDGSVRIFDEQGNNSNTRDPMLIGVPSGGNTTNFHLIYSAYPKHHDAVYARVIGARTSNASAALLDFDRWRTSRSSRVGGGGVTGTGMFGSECPFMVHHPPSGYYYLFRTQSYDNGGITRVYASRDPSRFGVGAVSDAFLVAELNVCAPEIVAMDDGSGRFFVVSLKKGLDGMRVGKLVFE